MSQPLPVGENRVRLTDSRHSLRPEDFKVPVLKQGSTTQNLQIPLPTGRSELDRLLEGGIPRGKITEIVGADSSGKTSLLFSILAQATGGDEIVAYIDACDSLDPKCAQKAGIDLQYFLWIRCKAVGAGPLEQALKASDILCQAGGFGVIALDIAGNYRHRLGDHRVPLRSWFRLQRAIQGTPTAFLVISSQKIAGSASSVILSLRRNKSCWIPERRSRFISKPYFQGIESEADLLKGRSHGSVTVHCRF